MRVDQGPFLLPPSKTSSQFQDTYARNRRLTAEITMYNMKESYSWRLEVQNNQCSDVVLASDDGVDALADGSTDESGGGLDIRSAANIVGAGAIGVSTFARRFRGADGAFPYSRFRFT